MNLHEFKKILLEECILTLKNMNSILVKKFLPYIFHLWKLYDRIFSSAKTQIWGKQFLILFLVANLLLRSNINFCEKKLHAKFDFLC